MTDHETDDEADEGAKASPEGGADADADAGTDADTEGESDTQAEGDTESESGAGSVPAEEKDRLEALQDDIEEVRRRVGESGEGAGAVSEEGGKRFIEEGAADEDQPVDDTIAPPG